MCLNEIAIICIVDCALNTTGKTDSSQISVTLTWAGPLDKHQDLVHVHSSHSFLLNTIVGLSIFPKKGSEMNCPRFTGTTMLRVPGFHPASQSSIMVFRAMEVKITPPSAQRADQKEGSVAIMHDQQSSREKKRKYLLLLHIKGVSTLVRQHCTYSKMSNWKETFRAARDMRLGSMQKNVMLCAMISISQAEMAVENNIMLLQNAYWHF